MRLLHLRLLAIVSCLLAAGAALAQPAGEIRLHDSDNCQGDYRTLIASVADLSEQGFDNAANSFQVLSGTWRLFRDADYGIGNGPSLPVDPVSHSGCANIGQASNGSFPANRLSAVRLEAAGELPSNTIVLYDLPGMAGEFRWLTDSEADFNRIGFDNRAASVWVQSGFWRLYRNQDFGQSPDRPSVAVATGQYPDIGQVAGYPAGTFPPDLMSSAAAIPPRTYDPPPGAMVCQPPYYQSVAGSCALVCGAGTRGIAGGTESAATPCTCQPGLVPQGEDEQGRLVCGIASLSQPPSPGRLSCRPNSTFDDARGECTCIEGTVETARDALGRPTCLSRRIGPLPPVTATPVTPVPPAPQAYEIDGLVAASYANARGWRTVARPITNAACMEAVSVVTVQYVPRAPGVSALISGRCEIIFLAGPDLRDGWRFDGAIVELSDVVAFDPLFEASGLNRASPQIPSTVDAAHTFATGSVRLVQVRLLGPAGLTLPQVLEAAFGP